jgi:serine protease SohB
VDLGRVATGEYWHGTKAMELGLVDEVKTSDDYLLEESRNADIYLVTYAVHKKPVERLLSSVRNAVLRALGGRWNHSV